MSERRRGLIGFARRCPGLCLTAAGAALTLASLANLAILRFLPTGNKLFRPGLFGWPSLGPIPLPLLMLLGTAGLATATAMLLAAAYLRGPPSRSRLFGCGFVGVGIVGAGSSIALGAAAVLQGMILIAIGALLLGRAIRTPPRPIPGESKSPERAPFRI